MAFYCVYNFRALHCENHFQSFSGTWYPTATTSLIFFTLGTCRSPFSFDALRITLADPDAPGAEAGFGLDFGATISGRAAGAGGEGEGEGAGAGGAAAAFGACREQGRAIQWL